MSKYTWVPFFEEMADKLLSFANKQIVLYHCGAISHGFRLNFD